METKLIERLRDAIFYNQAGNFYTLASSIIDWRGRYSNKIGNLPSIYCQITHLTVSDYP